MRFSIASHYVLKKNSFKSIIKTKMVTANRGETIPMPDYSG